MKIFFTILKILDGLYGFRLFSFRKRLFYNSKNSRFTNSDIERCLSVVPKEFLMFKVKIIIPRNKISAFLYHISPFSGCLIRNVFIILFSSSIGYYQNWVKTICILPFNLKNLPGDKEVARSVEGLILSYTLFHELKHVYQYHFQKELFDDGGVSLNEVNYKTHPSEIDADKFAESIMNTHKDLFIDAFGLYYEYMIDGTVYQ